MPDFRYLPIAQRREIAADAERRARAGDSPKQICDALGLAPSTYWRWAKLFGFRRGDLNPADPLARVQLPKGKNGSGANAAFLLDEGLGGRARGGGPPRCVDLSREGLETAGTVLEAVEAAIEDGDTIRADRLIAAWRAQKRRKTALDELQQAAIESGERAPPIPFFDPVTGEGMMTMEWIKAASTETLIAYIKRKTGED